MVCMRQRAMLVVAAALIVASGGCSALVHSPRDSFFQTSMRNVGRTPLVILTLGISAGAFHKADYNRFVREANEMVAEGKTSLAEGQAIVNEAAYTRARKDADARAIAAALIMSGN